MQCWYFYISLRSQVKWKHRLDCSGGWERQNCKSETVEQLVQLGLVVEKCVIIENTNHNNCSVHLCFHRLCKSNDSCKIFESKILGENDSCCGSHDTPSAGPDISGIQTKYLSLPTDPSFLPSLSKARLFKLREIFEFSLDKKWVYLYLVTYLEWVSQCYDSKLLF